MWGSGKVQTGNSSLEIQLRQKKVLANRERLRVSRAASVLERHWCQNFRKLSSLERSLFVLMGRDPYSHCTKEETLFEYNPPGFCYRRDGRPRLMRSLQESKSRKIVNDLDGREGLTPQPAINVVSDNPQMAEILSSPELVQILCDLRNTAAIMSNEGLFTQFATALRNSSRNPLIGFEGPLDYLRQYRKNLIQEFFDALESETEMRFFLGHQKVDPNLSISKTKVDDVRSVPSSNLPDLVDGSVLATRRQSGVDWTLKRFMQNQDKDQVDVDDLPPLYSDKAIGLLTSKYLEESRREMVNQSPNGNFGGSLAESSTTMQKRLAQLHPDVINKRVIKEKRAEFDSFVRHLISKIEILDEMGQHLLVFRRKRPNRHSALIDPLVKLLKKQSLFSSLTDADLRQSSAEVNVPANNSSQTSLSKRIITSSPSQPSINVKYFKVPEQEGPEREETLSKTNFLGLATPKTGPFNIFHRPTRSQTSIKFSNSSLKQETSSHNDVSSTPTTSRSRRSSGTRVEQDANQNVQNLENLEDEEMSFNKHVHFEGAATAGAGNAAQRPTSVSFSNKSPTICESSASSNCATTGKCSTTCSTNATTTTTSMRRVTCRACREKVKQACTQMQQRDAIMKCSKSKDAYAWKIPELTNWPHEYKELPAGVRGRDSVRSLSEIRRKEKMAKSVYLTPPPKSISFQKGAPTPRFPRRSSIIIPPDFSAFSYKNQSPRFGEDMMNIFKADGRTGVDEEGQDEVKSSAFGSTAGFSYWDAGSRSKMSISGRKTHSAVSGGSFSSIATGGGNNTVNRSKSTFMSGGGVAGTKPAHSDSWTLRVSIMRLKHELDMLTVKDKMLEFEHKFLNL